MDLNNNTRVKLDRSQLLGFDQLSAVTPIDAPGLASADLAKIGPKVGQPKPSVSSDLAAAELAKIGPKVGLIKPRD